MRPGVSSGLGGLSVLLKKGQKGFCLEDPSPTLFLRSTTSLDNFFTSLTTLSKSLGSFSGGLVRSKGFFQLDLVSSVVGWLPKERIYFSTSLDSSKFSAKVGLSSSFDKHAYGGV
jgi:hypothetical protein